MRVAAGLLLCQWAVVALAEEVNNRSLIARLPAQRLSEYRLFANLAEQRPSAGVHPYDLITPLFSDYAEKFRFVYVPADSPAHYRETEVFAFPVGSVLIKTFAYPRDLQRPSQAVRLLETRLLIHKKEGWQALAYVWNRDHTDAVLNVTGEVLNITFRDFEGKAREVEYVVPNKNQCKGCHSYNGAVTPIGPKARNLNRVFTYAGGTKNQLAYWSANGLLTGTPEPEHAPRMLPWDDTSAPLSLRARAYLDVNCAHCHRSEGAASSSGLFLTYGEQRPVAWGMKKRPTAAVRGSGSMGFDIEPGRPERSILLYRMTSTEPGILMPELGRTLVHDEAAALIRAWIASLK